MLLGYIGLVYSFLGDLLIFNEVPYALEIAGVCLILLNNIIVLWANWDQRGEYVETQRTLSARSVPDTEKA